jgi:hypothetical protein
LFLYLLFVFWFLSYIEFVFIVIRISLVTRPCTEYNNLYYYCTLRDKKFTPRIFVPLSVDCKLRFFVFVCRVRIIGDFTFICPIVLYVDKNFENSFELFAKLTQDGFFQFLCLSLSEN